ncbi:hypothetical protein GUJ93_ZPchr0009g296 [Zizania palustris]|uniref:Uncharacterized protein n=1 Tax=Zizania palustris TaxID=103762 RepID=A0A8J5V8B6_ZIZPA|nr:hypothetical protein GUJ93_ZPchr0009g296 [Zizania palustris]
MAGPLGLLSPGRAQPPQDKETVETRRPELRPPHRHSLLSLACSGESKTLAAFDLFVAPPACRPAIRASGLLSPDLSCPAPSWSCSGTRTLI